MGDTPPSQRHFNDRQQAEAAQAVATRCLLPDPRNDGVLASIGNTLAGWVGLGSINDASTQSCARRQIAGKAELYDTPAPQPGSREYRAIMELARTRAEAGARLCQVRDFDDAQDEPNRYVGYRAANGRCAVRTEARGRGRD
ncbi:MAG: hypothetical protein DI582_01685 [Azospirillum brasilense]|nr:MAG: hypothetical protein DI582_01685 [Azospirillum brasilense]